MLPNFDIALKPTEPDCVLPGQCTPYLGLLAIFYYFYYYLFGSHAPIYTSLATFAATRLQNISLQFSHIYALFRLHLEGGTSQQPFKICLASLG